MPKPKRSLSRNDRAVTGSKTGAKPPVQIVPSVNEPPSVVPGSLSRVELQTQAAVHSFLRRTEKIAKAQVTQRARGEVHPVAFDVEVPDLWSEAADQVYTLRGDLFRKYPDAQIEIEVRGRREGGKAVSAEGNEEQ